MYTDLCKLFNFNLCDYTDPAKDVGFCCGCCPLYYPIENPKDENPLSILNYLTEIRNRLEDAIGYL